MSAISEILQVESPLNYFSDITKFEYHTHTTYSGQKLEPCDEVRLAINQMDLHTLPCKSFLYIEGKVKCMKPAAKAGDPDVAADYKISSNGLGFLFDEIRYEIGGQAIAKTRLAGLSSSVKGLLLKSANDRNTYHLAGFSRAGYKPENDQFVFCIPLKLLLPFFEDFQRIILNLKQELVLLRSSSDINCIESALATSVSIDIQKIQWRVPYIHVEDHLKLKFLKMLDSDRPLKLAFRKWELHELPHMPSSKVHSWSIKTAARGDTPRYVILTFQTDRKNNFKKSMAEFDLCDLHNIKVFLNSEYFPYDNLLGNKEIMYRWFLDFAPSYYNKGIIAEHGHDIYFDNFCGNAPILVIDTSHQNERLKSSTDIRLDLEFNKEVPANTSAYCFLISDCLIEYRPLTSIVREVQ